MPRGLGRWLRALGMALGLYTAVPGFARWDEESRGLLAAALPAVGLLLGLGWFGVAAFAGAFLPESVGAVAVALAMPLLTGFLHLDGLMDVADAALSARSPEEKRRILKDPHTGAFGVIALACLLLGQAAAARDALGRAAPLEALAYLPVISRALAGLALMTLTPMEGSAYGRMNREGATAGRRLFCAGMLLCVAGVAFVRTGVGGWACVACMLAFGAVCWAGIRSLGGMNGDIAGCAICVGELAGLVALACLPVR